MKGQKELEPTEDTGLRCVQVEGGSGRSTKALGQRRPWAMEQLCVYLEEKEGGGGPGP